METINHFISVVRINGPMTLIESIIGAVIMSGGLLLIRKIQIAFGVKDPKEKKPAQTAASH